MVDKPSGEKSLEMRVAELEDKLAQVHITEDDLKAYHKVSSLLATPAAVCNWGNRAPAAACSAPPAPGVAPPYHQAITQWQQPIIRPIMVCWYECGWGLPGNPAGGVQYPGDQFGGLGG